MESMDDKEDDSLQRDSPNNEEESGSDTDDSDDNNEEMDMTEVRQLDEELSVNRYDYGKHVQLIEKLESCGELDLLRSARERMSKVYPLTPQMWLKWINDEIRIAANDDDKLEVIKLFERAVNDYVSLDVWLEYVQFSIGLMQKLTVDGVRKIFEQSLTNVGINVDKGILLWDTYREFETFILQMMLKSHKNEVNDEIKDQIQRIYEIYRREVSIPLIGMDNVIKECEQWCQDIQKDFSIDLNFVAIKQTYETSFKQLEKLIPYEESLTNSESPHLDQYLRYVEYETKNGAPNRVQSVYERALIDNCLVPDLWLKYTNYLDKKVVIDTILLPVYERALRNCTWSSIIWINYMKAMERLKSDHQKVMSALENALMAGFQQPSEYLQLWLTYLDYLRRRTNWSDDKEVQSLRSTLKKADEHLANIADSDPNSSVLQYWAKIEAKFCKNIEESRKIWNKLMEQRHDISSQVENWIAYSRLERVFGDDKHYRKVLLRGLTTCTDWPETIGQIILEFEREEGPNIESYDEALDKYENVIQKITQKRKDLAEKESEKRKQMRAQKKSEKYELKRAAKRKAEQEMPSKSQTDSDGFKVPQPSSSVSTPKKARQEPNQPKTRQETSQTKAKEEKAVIKDRRDTGDEPKHGTSYKGDGSKDLQTVFISNLDFKIEENQLKEAFEKFGQIDDIRLVRNYKGLSKGYAYIEYSSIASVREALKHDRMPLEGRPVFISEMGKRPKFKYSTSIEKNKIFVKNLPPELTEQDLKTMFDKYGSVKEVRLVTYRNGHSKGCAYVEFHDESSAQEAVKQADNLQVGDNTISVAISNPNAKTSKNEEPVKQPMEHHATRPSRSKINAPMIPTSVRVQRLAQNGGKSAANGSTSSADGIAAPKSNSDFRELLLKK